MLYAEGTLCAETFALRAIARKKVNVAIKSIEHKTEMLLDSLLENLTPQIERGITAQSLLKAVLTHQQMKQENETIACYSRDFPELESEVVERRKRIELNIVRRLEFALTPLETSRKFRFTKGFRIH